MLIEDFGATPVWWCVGQRARACVERGTNERRARVGGVNNLYACMGGGERNGRVLVKCVKQST